MKLSKIENKLVDQMARPGGFTWPGAIGPYQDTKRGLEKLAAKGLAARDEGETSYRLTDAGRDFVEDHEPSSLFSAASRG